MGVSSIIVFCLQVGGVCCNQNQEIYGQMTGPWVSYNMHSMATTKAYTTVSEFIYIAKMSEEPGSLLVVETANKRKDMFVMKRHSACLTNWRARYSLN